MDRLRPRKARDSALSIGYTPGADESIDATAPTAIDPAEVTVASLARP